MASGSESFPLGEKGVVFSQRISEGNRGSRFIGATRRGQSSPMDTLLKRPTREPWNRRSVDPL
ncbi:MAG: hypothetical protein R6T98_14670 [Desulfatiglandales bacterium]